jgi:hypothetical protein
MEEILTMLETIVNTIICTISRGVDACLEKQGSPNLGGKVIELEKKIDGAFDQ